MDHEFESWLRKVWARENQRVDSGVQLPSVNIANSGTAWDFGRNSSIVGRPTHWYDNLEDVINKIVSLEADIGRYQSTLKYARSTLDYSVGKGLYMLPSNMLLKPLNQVIDGFNDKIIVNGGGFELGKQRKPALKQAIAKKPVVERAVKRRIHTLNAISRTSYRGTIAFWMVVGTLDGSL